MLPIRPKNFSDPRPLQPISPQPRVLVSDGGCVLSRINSDKRMLAGVWRK
jgi:hypothetical protein